MGQTFQGMEESTILRGSQVRPDSHDLQGLEQPMILLLFLRFYDLEIKKCLFKRRPNCTVVQCKLNEQNIGDSPFPP
jgi:hypothetical protein